MQAASWIWALIIVPGWWTFDSFNPYLISERFLPHEHSSYLHALKCVCVYVRVEGNVNKKAIHETLNSFADDEVHVQYIIHGWYKNILNKFEK